MQKHHIRTLFDSIAPRYDLLNHILSAGIDISWRRKAVEQMREVHPRRILDVATGTADVALACVRLNPETVIGVDIAERMLDIGRRKVARRGLDSVISLRAGDAEHLDFMAGFFDAAIVAFGARNFENLDRGLAEMYRVLRDGGKIVVLEFSRPTAFPFRQIYLLYFLKILPFIGALVSRDEEAYRYLPESVMKFPDGSDFLQVLERAGFSEGRVERLTFGIASIYSASKSRTPGQPLR